MIGLIVGLVFIGIICGYLARLIVPGKDDLSFLQTMVLGIIGSFVGGFLGYLIHHDSDGGFVQTSGWIGSLIGSIVALLVYNATTGRKRHHAHV
jgi:uncharacterized membrane protein YeaQ/YmgE (transglycosylase-associated protein family)